MSSFESSILRLLIVCLLLTFMTIGSCYSYNNTLEKSTMVELVERGANPLDASCAVNRSSTSNECLIRNAK